MKKKWVIIKIKKTEKKNICPIFGRSKVLPTDVLPTYSDIIKFYLWCELKSPFEFIAKKIIENWHCVGIPTVPKRTVVSRIRCLHKEYKNVLKSHGSQKCGKNFSAKLNRFPR